MVKPNNYILNGQKVSFKEMKNFVETADDIDVATADIKIEGDDVLAEKAYNKQNDAIIAMQRAFEEEHGTYDVNIQDGVINYRDEQTDKKD